MSAPPATIPAHDHSQEASKFQIYVNVAMLLAIITGVEIVGIYLPFDKWIIVTGLILLSVVKFIYVLFYFMHLRWDKPFCTIMFSIGLVLSVGTVWALLAIFSVKDSLPLPT